VSLAEAVSEALEVSAPSESQQRVHEVIARQLDSISPGAEVKSTEYFNHAWVPDLVVAGRDGEERDVFLRFQVRDESFGDDLEHLADRKPVFLDISERRQLADDASADDFDLGSAIEARGPGGEGVLVTEVDAIDKFESSVREYQPAAIATKEVVVGGRGIVDPSAATSIVESWKEARDAASDARSDRLRAALDDVETFLDRVSSLDLEADLRGTWVAAGHDVESFPGSEEWRLGDRSPREIAELVASLLRQGRPISEGQWSAIGEVISASSLGHEVSRLNQKHVGSLVNDLTRSNLTRWTAKYAYVPTLESDSLTDAFDWSLGEYALALNLIRRTAYFTDIGIKWNRMKKADSLPEIRERIEGFGDRDVLGVGIETPEENVSHELRSTATRTLAEHVQPLVDGASGWRTARLQWLELRIPGTELTAKVDFRRNVVSADASIPIATFALLLAKYVVALTPDELNQLSESLQSTLPAEGRVQGADL
jgi:hypothetical protein